MVQCKNVFIYLLTYLDTSLMAITQLLFTRNSISSEKNERKSTSELQHNNSNKSYDRCQLTQ